MFILFFDFTYLTHKNVKDVHVAIATVFIGDLIFENKEDGHE